MTNLYANATVANNGCVNPENAHGEPDGVWTGNDDTSENWDCRWGMANPPSDLDGTQTINVLVRKNETGGNGDPTIQVELYESGTQIAVLQAATAVSSTAGVTVGGTFDASVLSDISGAGVEIYLDSVGPGGMPAGRRAVQVDSIEWVAALDVPPSEAPVLSLVDKFDTIINMEWTTVDGATGYDFQVDGETLLRDEDTDFDSIAVTVEPLTEYTFRVRGFNGAGDGPWSNEVTVTSEGEIVTSPVLTLVDTTESSIQLSWNSVQYAETYDLYRDDVLVFSGGGLGFLDEGLAGSYTQYKYNILAKNSASTGPLSPDYLFSTSPGPAIAPTLVSPADLSTADGTSFSWNYETDNVSVENVQHSFSMKVGPFKRWSETTRVFPFEASDTSNASIHPDNDKFIHWRPDQVSGLVEDYEFVVYDAKTLLRIDTFSFGFNVLSVTCGTYSPNGQYISISQDSSSPGIHVLDTTDYTTIAGIGTGISASFRRETRWSPDGSLVAFATSGGLVVYSSSTWEEVFKDDTKDYLSCKFSEDGTYLAAGMTDDPYYEIYNTADWSKLSELPSAQALVFNLSFSHDGSMLSLLGSAHPRLDILNMGDLSLFSPSFPDIGNPRSLFFMNDSKRLMIVHQTGVSVLDTNNWSVLKEQPSSLPSAYNIGHNYMSLSSDEMYLVNRSRYPIRPVSGIYQPPSFFTSFARPYSFSSTFNGSVSASKDGSAFGFGGGETADGFTRLRIWNMSGGLFDQEKTSMGANTAIVRDIAISDTGSLAAHRRDTGRVSLWEIGSSNTGTFLTSISTDSSGPEAVRFSHSELFLAAGNGSNLNNSNSTYIIETTDPYTTLFLDEPKGLARCYDFTSDDSLLFIITARDGGQLYSVNTTDWTEETGHPTFGTGTHPRWIRFSNSGTRVAITHEDGLRVYDYPSWDLVEHNTAVGALNRLDWSHDDNYLVVCRDTSPSILMFNTSTWLEEDVVEVTEKCGSVAFMNNGTYDFAAIIEAHETKGPSFKSPYLLIKDESDRWWNKNRWVAKETYIPTSTESVSLPAEVWPE